MHFLRFSMSSCIRNKKKAILNLFICMVTVIMINVFVKNLISIEQQMEQLPNVVKIQTIVSNLNGMMDSGLKIKEEYMDEVLASKYIESPAFSVQLKLGFGEFGVDEYFGNLNYYAMGCNSRNAIRGLREDEMKFMEGESGDTFFHSTERVCMMDERLMTERNLALGDEITLTNYYYRFGQYHDIYIEPLETGTFTIAGTMNMLEYLGEGVQPDVIFPLETVRQIFHKEGMLFTADAGSFQVKDPYELNEFKKEMHDIGFLPVSFQSEFQYDGNALVVRDETFVSSAEQLIKTKNLLQDILPFLVLAVLCIGFVMAQLLMKGRLKDYAIMRSLGQSHRESFRMLVLEYGFSAVIGSTIGSIIGVSCLDTFWEASVLATITFVLCYLIGTMAALSSLKRLSVMSILSKND